MSPDAEIAEGLTANDLSNSEIEPWIQGLVLHRITVFPLPLTGETAFPRQSRQSSSLQPGAAIIEDGPSISRKSVPDARTDVPEWVAEPTLSDTALAGNKMACRVKNREALERFPIF